MDQFVTIDVVGGIGPQEWRVRALHRPHLRLLHLLGSLPLEAVSPPLGSIKHKYPSDVDSSAAHCPSFIVFTLLPPLVAFLLGSVARLAHTRFNQVEPVAIPFRKALVCGAVINCNMWTYNTAIEWASFPAAIMVKSCSLLSVILVGIFCSRVKDSSLKLGTNKLVIGGVVTAGILLFNIFKGTETGNDRPITLLSTALLLVSLLGDGVLPDLQA